ncbi:FHA domain-containing protein [Wuchereria bancrofti]|uniref:FHA domain-containing protein n=1 Tax=Wuchereria bancrofti TaxID=6293 RepID=J9EJK8_WUCBA|nr:FHA domain-containing protein [Wuchereria bancrofti]
MTGMRCPYAILTACSQSHAFEERRFTVPNSEEEAVKIGRSVARWKPSSDNAIFDCKVLSRNHAVLWHEEGYFLLKDTKSSNGTFVNNDRLSKSAEESSPRQIYSGDILQFGVEISENANKVTHGCILAMIRLYDANGEEACPPDNMEINGYLRAHGNDSLMFPLIDSHQLFQLQHYMREAMYRERALEQKLTMLESILSSTEQAAESGCQALISEDQLLSRIEMLEGQLALYSRNILSEKVKEQMSDLLVDKNKFESLAKESLRRAQEERCEALLRLADVERSLLNAEEESSVLRQRVSDLQNELSVAVDANRLLRDHVSQLKKQLRAMEIKYGDLENKNFSINLLCDKSRIKEKAGLKISDSQYLNASQGENGYAKLYLCDEKSQAMLEVRLTSCRSNYDFGALLLCALPLFSVMFIVYSLGTMLTSSILSKIKRE